ncbi:MAG: hypothetical protein KIG70_01300, partial [Treponema sp.]|uniref:hypothetical protein n=1 Tax=Treponema sp. TaxID=166 RepID=UPI001DE97FC0
FFPSLILYFKYLATFVAALALAASDVNISSFMILCQQLFSFFSKIFDFFFTFFCTRISLNLQENSPYQYLHFRNFFYFLLTEFAEY